LFSRQRPRGKSDYNRVISREENIGDDDLAERNPKER
jgi:hypothetical protein